MPWLLDGLAPSEKSARDAEFEWLLCIASAFQLLERRQISRLERRLQRLEDDSARARI